MRIFCAVRHSADPAFFYGGLWSGNFYPALRELGHEVIESQTDLFATSRFMAVAAEFTPEERAVRAQTTERILNEVRAAMRIGPLHLFLSYFYNAHFDPAGFDELRALGIPSVNFYCNSIYQFGLVSTIAAKVDLSWHAERDARELYLAVGAKPIWVQMGADPSVYQPVSGALRQSKACFVGQRYADRDRWLATLVHAAIPLDIYGAGWGVSADRDAASQDVNNAGYLGRKLSSPGGFTSYIAAIRKTFHNEGVVGGINRLFRQWRYRGETQRLSELLRPFTRGSAIDMPTVLAQYEVCVNCSNVWADGRPGSRLIPHVRLRDFEAPMSRSCYLTGHTEEITEFYEIGHEIDTYRSPEELVDKTRFYLAHPSAAEKLRESGYRRALRDHTWKRRFEELFRKVGLQG